MKICADEHISEKIVEAIETIAIGDGFEITSVKRLELSGRSDCYWIEKFKKDDGAAIISGDKDFYKKPPQVVAVERTGLIVINMPPKWCNSTARLQLTHMLMWWPRIENKLRDANPRECWQPPWNIKETGDLKQIKLDFRNARKKLKKAQRSSRQVPPSRP